MICVLFFLRSAASLTVSVPRRMGSLPGTKTTYIGALRLSQGLGTGVGHPSPIRQAPCGAGRGYKPRSP